MLKSELLNHYKLINSLNIDINNLKNKTNNFQRTRNQRNFNLY
jgi:hypothetical protein